LVPAHLTHDSAKIVPKALPFVMLFLALAGCADTRNTPRCDAQFKEGELREYVLENDNVVRDTRSGLKWFRCAAGQTVQAGMCLGDPLRLTWDEAHQYAQEFSEASGKTWRMPTYGEMKDASEPDCQNPAYNPNAFPNLPIENFWTSTEQIGTVGQACQVFSYTGHGHCRAFKRDGYLLMLVTDQ
jgi:hypothetical protein